MSDSEDSQVNSDIEAEERLNSEQQPTEIINDEEGIKRALEDISYKLTTDKKVPWLERLDLVVDAEVPAEIARHDDIARENAFHDIALTGMRECLRKLKNLNEKFMRPADFYAEMVKTDEEMRRVEAKLSSQSIAIQKNAERRAKQAAKKTKKGKTDSGKKGKPESGNKEKGPGKQSVGRQSAGSSGKPSHKGQVKKTGNKPSGRKPTGRKPAGKRH